MSHFICFFACLFCLLFLQNDNEVPVFYFFDLEKLVLDNGVLVNNGCA